MPNFQLTQNGQQVQRDLNLIEAGLASEYSSLSTYVVGDIVVHIDKVYKCTTAVSEPGVFDSNKWTQTTIAAVLAEKLSSVKVVNINSESATQGQVLTADGNGGASWQNASGGNGINGYTLTYDMAQGILSSLFLEYLYVDGNGNIKSDEILSDGTHKSGTLTNVLMVKYNSTALNHASISGSNFDVYRDETNQIYTVWLTDNRQYNAQSGGGGDN